MLGSEADCLAFDSGGNLYVGGVASFQQLVGKNRYTTVSTSVVRRYAAGGFVGQPNGASSTFGPGVVLAIAVENGVVYAAGNASTTCSGGRGKPQWSMDWYVHRGTFTGSAWNTTEDDHYTLVPCAAAYPTDMLVDTSGYVYVVGGGYDTPSQAIDHWIVRWNRPTSQP
jgi:hypothetical protein